MNREARTLIAAALGCGVLFALVVAAAYAVGPVERLDAKSLRSLWVIADNGDALAPHVIAHLADPAPLVLFLGAIAAVGLYLGRREHVVAAIAAVGCAAVASQVFKVVLAHPRIDPLYLSLHEAALPSGHAVAAMSVAVAAVVIAPRSLRVPAAVGGALFAIAVGISVVSLGWHYPADVLAGYLLAVGFGLAALAVLRVRSPEGAAEATRAARSASGLGLAAFAGLVIAVASIRSDDLLDQMRDHTAGMGAALAIAASAVVLILLFTFAARESRVASG